MDSSSIISVCVPPGYDSVALMALSPSTLPNLTSCITKQGLYPAAHGGFADIWLCTLNNKSYEPPVAQNVGGCRVYSFLSIPKLPTQVAVKVLRSFGSPGVESEKKYQKVRNNACLARPPVTVPRTEFIRDCGGNWQFG